MTLEIAERPRRRRWSWSPDKRLAYGRRRSEAWEQREAIVPDPEKGLGYLKRGSFCSFAESVARVRDPGRRVRCENWSKFRP